MKTSIVFSCNRQRRWLEILNFFDFRYNNSLIFSIYLKDNPSCTRGMKLYITGFVKKEMRLFLFPLNGTIRLKILTH